jgi:hypothetical protein
MSGFVRKYLAFSAFQKVPALRRAVGSEEFLVESKNSIKNLHSVPSIATAMAGGKTLMTRAVKRMLQTMSLWRTHSKCVQVSPFPCRGGLSHSIRIHRRDATTTSGRLDMVPFHICYQAITSRRITGILAHNSIRRAASTYLEYWLNTVSSLHTDTTARARVWNATQRSYTCRGAR